MAFTKLGLNDLLVQGILATGYTAPTEIQTRAIPAGLAGHDIIGCAQTGTGKTAAFVLPLLQRLAHSIQRDKHRRIRALVLTPTRELAQQVEDSVNEYGRFMTMQTLAIFGGADMQKQMRKLKSGVDIVVATPGRLLDHIARKTIDLSHVEFFVLDEADRMFDMGFINDVKKIVHMIPTDRQTLLFSATMEKKIRDLASSILKNPLSIEVGERHDPVHSVTQHFYSIPADSKLALLFHIIKTVQSDSILVFSRTKHGADKISRRLERDGIKAVAIHSNRTQSQRERALAGFKQGLYNVMVATDIASRGIDVEGISHVINYDVPHFAEDYIHRIGRTGRAHATGDAVTFVSNGELSHFKDIERFTGKKFELKRHPSFDYTVKHEREHHQEEKKDFRKEGYKKRNTPKEQFPRHKSYKKHDQPGGRSPKPEIPGAHNPSAQPRSEETSLQLYSRKPSHFKKGPKRDWRALISTSEDQNKNRKKKQKKF